MNRLTLQDVLDKNYEWFVVQKMPPGYDVENIACTYDGPPVDGKPCRCSIGCVLPDDVRSIAKKCGGAVTAIVFNDKIRNVLPENIGALQNLQCRHDDSADKSDFHGAFQTHLQDWAAKYGLRWPGKAA